MVTIKRQEGNGTGGGSSDREPIPDKSVFEAEVLTVNLEDSKYYKNEDGTPQEIVNFKFKITDDGDFHDRWVWGSTPPWLNDSPRCKLRHWVEAILDIDILPTDYLLETDNLQGMKCRVIVTAKESTVTPGRMNNKVSELRSSKATSSLPVGQSPDDLAEEPF